MAREKEEELQPSTFASKSTTREKPHHWLPVMNARLAMAEDLAELMKEEVLHSVPSAHQCQSHGVLVMQSCYLV